MPAFLFQILPALKSIGRLLAFGVTIPLGVILAAGIWLHFDKTSSIREAVDRAVKEMVAGAELESARATAAAERMLRLDAEARNRAAEAANRRFAERQAQVETEMGNLNDQISELLARPVDGACIVDDDLYRRLRNR